MANVGNNTKAIRAAYALLSASERRIARQRIQDEIGITETAFRARLRGESNWRPLELAKAMEILGCHEPA